MVIIIMHVRKSKSLLHIFEKPKLFLKVSAGLPFILRSFSKHGLSTFCAPDTVLGSGETQENKNILVPSL